MSLCSISFSSTISSFTTLSEEVISVMFCSVCTTGTSSSEPLAKQPLPEQKIKDTALLSCSERKKEKRGIKDAGRSCNSVCRKRER